MNVAFPFNMTLLIAKRLQKVNGLVYTFTLLLFKFLDFGIISEKYNILTFDECLY